MILEGMISGLAVVATPTGGTTEIIKDGENGSLVTPGDAEDLARKITQLLDDPELRQKLSKAGKQTVLESYTITKMLDQLESFLDEVAGNSITERTNHLVSGEQVVS